MSVVERRLRGVYFDLSPPEPIPLEEWPAEFRRDRRPIVGMECVNCGAQFGRPRCSHSPYCSNRCHDQAKFVRKARKVRERYGNNIPPELREVLRKQFAFALGEGYDAPKRRLPDEVRRAVWERTGDLCESCGQPGAEVDHKDGSSPALHNLQLLCVACHDRKTALGFRRILSPKMLLERRVLLRRVEAKAPERPCDTDDWDEAWRAWRREHAVRG